MFRRGFNNRRIHAIYGTIVSQARAATFYTDYGVADTVEGRFELIVLHLVLLLGRLDRESKPASGPVSGRTVRAPASRLGQQLFDVFCRDLDDNLREMAVGDLAVPRKMRSFGEAFYGRQAAYRAALASANAQELEKALARNIFGSVDVDDRALRLARYVRAAARQLDAEEEDALAPGAVVFPCAEGFAHV